MKSQFEKLDLAKFNTLEKKEMGKVFGGYECATGSGNKEGVGAYSADTKLIDDCNGTIIKTTFHTTGDKSEAKEQCQQI